MTMIFGNRQEIRQLMRQCLFRLFAEMSIIYCNQHFSRRNILFHYLSVSFDASFDASDIIEGLLS